MKYKSKVNQIAQGVRNLALRHNFYFQIIGSLLVLGFLTYLHFMHPPSMDVINETPVAKWGKTLEYLAHCLMFFLSMMWFMYITIKLHWQAVGISLILFGLMLELMQMNFIDYRSFELMDLISDGIGVVLCFFIVRVLTDKFFDSSV